MHVLDAAACTAALPFERLIPALQALFASGCVVPPRHVHQISTADGAGLTSLVMPAWLPGRCYGIKIVNIAPGNSARGLPGLHGVYLLFDAETGRPLAQLDGTVLTARRTAAASALAASLLAPPEAAHLLLVGAGAVARLLPSAYRVVRPISQVTVWARRPAQAAALADELRHQGLHAQASTDLPGACAQADIVSCATLATEPVVQGRWLRPGSHLDLIGSFTPAMREADDDCLRHDVAGGARLYIDTDEACRKSGDLIGPLARAVIGPEAICADLATLCRAAGALPPDGRRTVFKSVGTALEDLAAAMLVAAGTGIIDIPEVPHIPHIPHVQDTPDTQDMTAIGRNADRAPQPLANPKSR
jgi:ornithine cyclodeaminase